MVIFVVFASLLCMVFFFIPVYYFFYFQIVTTYSSSLLRPFSMTSLILVLSSSTSPVSFCFTLPCVTSDYFSLLSLSLPMKYTLTRLRSTMRQSLSLILIQHYIVLFRILLFLLPSSPSSSASSCSSSSSSPLALCPVGYVRCEGAVPKLSIRDAARIPQ